MTPNDDRTAALPDAVAADNTASLGHTGPEPAHAPDDLPRLGKYRILGVLGRGGMGAVYRAEDPVLRRVVALKVMLPKAAADPLSRERFLREARAQAAVEHDHVLPIFDVVDDAAVPFIAMPLLRGMTLADALRANPRPPLAEVVRIARETAEGLAAAHATGLVHRDIKPANIWLEAGRLRVKVLDFGLARAAGEVDGSSTAHQPVAADTHLTNTGAVLGTPAYMSPEQALGQPLDPRTDLFSLGVVLYQMLAGRAPFPGRAAAEVMTAVVRVEPLPVAELVPDLPPALADLVMRLLAKSPATRPPSASAVAAELGAIETTLTAATLTAAEPWGDLGDDAPTLTETRPVVRRRGSPWVPVALAVVGMFVVAAAVAALMWGKSATETAYLDIDDAGAEAVELTLKRDGVPVSERTKERKFALPPGVYTVEVSAPDAAVKLSSGLVTLDRGGREKLTLRLDERLTVARKLDDFNPDNPEWLKLFLKQPPKTQISRVAAELRRLNPNFDGKLDYTASGGDVVSLKVVTDGMADLRPIRALKNLRDLSAQQGVWDRGRFSDLSHLQGLLLTSLGVANSNPTVQGLEYLKAMPLKSLHIQLVSVPGELAHLRGHSLSVLSVFGKFELDLADVRACVADGARVDLRFPSMRNPAALIGKPLEWLSLSGEVVGDPAVAELAVQRLFVTEHDKHLLSGPRSDEALLARAGSQVRRNPHVKLIGEQPKDVFFAWIDLKPTPLAATWQVLGPFPDTAADPFDPKAAGGVMSADQLAAGVTLPDGKRIPWRAAGLDRLGDVDLEALFRKETGVAWLHTTFDELAAGRAVLFVTGNPAYQLWLNGTPVVGRATTREWLLNRNAVVVNLVQGRNAVTVRRALTATTPNQYPLGIHLHRLRPGEAPPAGIDPPAPPPK